MAAYMKYNVQFLGIKAPIRKEIQKEYLKECKKLSFQDCKEFAFRLYDLPYREFHYFSLEILDKHKRDLTSEFAPLAESLCLKNTWWDTIDYIATHIYNPVLMNMDVESRKTYVQYLASHQNMWLNRIGIIFQLPLKDKTNTSLLELAILPHIDSKEFFHKKAIGWALRQYSKYNPEYVRDFIDHTKLQALSIREASKYL